jgi:Glycosyl transferase family 2
VVLVRNEDLFVERAVRSVTAFCDRIHLLDHVSTDRTWEILRGLAREYDHIDASRTTHAGDSQRILDPYAGTDTWVFAVDGDELYDAQRLQGFRSELLAGAYSDAFKIGYNMLNCVAIDWEGRTATGYLSPPSRLARKLFNFAAVESWESDGAERLHGGTVTFKPGYGHDSVANIGDRLSWDETPLRCLHVTFLRRSSSDPEQEQPVLRPILMESAMQDRSWRGGLKRFLRRRKPPEVSEWKPQKYMRGDLVTVDAAPFLS